MSVEITIPSTCNTAHSSSFIKTPGDHTQWQKGNHSIAPDVVQTLRAAGLSDALLSNVYSETGYWAKMGNLQFSDRDSFGMGHHSTKAFFQLTGLQRYATSTDVAGMRRSATFTSYEPHLEAYTSVSTIPKKLLHACKIACKVIPSSSSKTSSWTHSLPMLARSNGL